MRYLDLPGITALSNLSEGDTGKIIRVRGKPDEHRNLCCMGLAIGRNIHVCDTENTSDGLSFMVKTGNKIAMLESNIAQNIKVRKLH